MFYNSKQNLNSWICMKTIILVFTVMSVLGISKKNIMFHNTYFK